MSGDTSSASSASALYTRLGWSILPVDGTSKKPLVPWKLFQSRLATRDEIQGWSRFSRAGIAVITGQVSKIVVLDADGPEGYDEVMGLGIPKTPLVRTPGGGLHAYFKWPTGLQPFRNSTKLGNSKRLDVRGEGAYVLAPFTRRADGRAYEWVVHPFKAALASVPAWFEGQLRALAEASQTHCGRPVGPPAVKAIKGPTGTPQIVELLARVGSVIRCYIERGADLTRFPSRSECDLAVVVALIAAGASDESIVEVFSSYPIGEKFDESGEAYLTRTIERARQHVKTVRIKYADLNEYTDSDSRFGAGRRIQLCLTVEEDNSVIRCGVSVPEGLREISCQDRWNRLIQATGLEDIAKDPTKVARLLVGKRMRIEIDTRKGRSNPVAAFHKE